MTSTITNNINLGLHWQQWTTSEKSQFVLCFYRKESKLSDTDFEMERIRLIRRLFGKLDTSSNPQFISEYYESMSLSDKKRFKDEGKIDSLRSDIIKNVLIHNGCKKPIY